MEQEKKKVGKGESCRHILLCLLHYHERMMMFAATPCGGLDDNLCPARMQADWYAEALREAIRCVETVHAEELSGID